MLENDALQSQMMATERDTIDVITYLKKQDHEKDSQLERFQSQIREMRKEHRQEKEMIVEDFSKQINDLEEKLGEKMREVELMQSELKMVKEFRRKRGLMQKELDEVKRAVFQKKKKKNLWKTCLYKLKYWKWVTNVSILTFRQKLFTEVSLKKIEI